MFFTGRSFGAEQKIRKYLVDNNYIDTVIQLPPDLFFGTTIAYVDYDDIPEKDVLTKESVVVKSRGIIGFAYIDKPFSHKNES